ncbi:response regulator transcription factor [Sediminispirochaeta smaragdinae]|jgi:DNA-binding NarL/FixJ family response regulator|uniref:Two component transcriptional regulator, LuxR family n=1 Tax=Sediminispirochaeta smaragdinae (strain DSM 11293 / JCM 15392 / SEBR 4228) TaxID=573413 RepID=E1R8Q3_SEDSS|nr:response regulator transcription factor [Sediminispirochaeta smaragdinae]ADK81810.1 two component transcriptional regulator, LuxR family [Sediminispirochaeta smaragdinae DSM 11293]
MIKVLIADDQEIIRDSLELLVNSDERFEVVGLPQNGREVVRLAAELNPDVVLMDIRMPEFNGIECVKLIKERNPAIKIIMLTTFDSDEYIYESLKNGADGFLLKGISKRDLINSIETVYNGGASIEPQTAQKVFTIFGKMAKSYFLNQDAEDIANLTDQEIRIIQLIGRGYSNKEIMGEVNFSEGTIRNYISMILKKIQLRDRTQIAIFAIQSGIMLRDIHGK